MKIICLLGEGFEDIEALGTVAILRRSGLQVDFVSVANVREVVGAFGTRVVADKMLKDIAEKDYDGIFVPGGRAAAALRENPEVTKLISAFGAKKKLLAAICAGPTVLAVSGLLDGKHYTSFPSTEVFIPKGIRENKASVIDGNIVTGAGAGTVMEFALDVIRAAFGADKSEEIQKRILFRHYEK